MKERDIASVFKLYPWEWLLHEFPDAILSTYPLMDWIEPIWKMLWSNKGLLAILWEMYPGHPNLLEAHLHDQSEMQSYARKPLLSREGANVSIVRAGTAQIKTSGDYGEEGYVYQALAPIPQFDGCYPVIGSWYVMDQGPAGIGIRESETLVTDNLSRFVPHYFE